MYVGPVSFALRARYADDGYDADASSARAGMDTREGEFWVGGAAILPMGVVTLSTELLSDVSDRSGGQQLKLAATRRFQAIGLDFTPRLTVTRFDQKYVDYYYGVRTKRQIAKFSEWAWLRLPTRTRSDDRLSASVQMMASACRSSLLIV
jgi:outer membrane protein